MTWYGSGTPREVGLHVLQSRDAPDVQIGQTPLQGSKFLGIPQDGESLLSAACIVHATLQDLGKPLQIRNVPEPVLESLRERADEVHMSLAAYVLEVLTEHVATKSMKQLLAGPRLRHGKPLGTREIQDLISHGRRC
jgi:plasmid stability protein